MSGGVTVVSVVTVTYNSGAFLDGFLASLYACDLAGIELQIIVIDNGSTDNTLAILEADYPGVETVRNSRNNYTNALNRGISLARGDFVVIANNDGTAHFNFLQGLLGVMQQYPRTGGVQSKILFSGSGLINSVGVEEVERLYFMDIGFEQRDGAQYRRNARRQYLSGGAVMLRRECLETVGGWDEDFILYLEDVDYSIRCREAGWDLMYTPDSLFIHHYHGTTTDALCDYFCSRNRLLLVSKHFPEEMAACITSSHFFSTGQLDLLYRSLLHALVKLCVEQDDEIASRVLVQVADVVATQFGKECHDELFFQLQLLLHLRPLRISVIGDFVEAEAAAGLASRLQQVYPDALVQVLDGDSIKQPPEQYDVCIDLSTQQAHRPLALRFLSEKLMSDDDGLALLDEIVLEISGIDALPQAVVMQR